MKFKEFVTLSEARWLAKTSLYDQIYAIVKDEFVKSKPVVDLLRKSGNELKITDEFMLASRFDDFGWKVSKRVEKLVQNTFVEHYPQLGNAWINIKASMRAPHTNGGTKGVTFPSRDKLEINVSLNLMANVEEFLKVVGGRKYIPDAVSKTDFNRAMILFVRDWTKTLYHEIVHVAQAIEIRLNNYKLYMDKFMPRHWVNKMLSKDGFAGSKAAYLDQVQEIQAHAISAAGNLMISMSGDKIRMLISHLEKFIDKANPKSKFWKNMDKFDIFLASHFNSINYVEYIMNNGNEHIMKLLSYEDFEIYIGSFIDGDLSKKTINRFIREVLRAVNDAGK